ncbi:MAG: type II toxin-antitoxin system VapC family toxin [bacterium]|nr:type II toxin-antitoxin system VapC family toxin [bacterium]
MEGYLLDTNILAYWFNASLREHAAVAHRIRELPRDTPLRVSVISLGEIEYGHRVVAPKDTPRQIEFLEFIDDRIPKVLDVTKLTRIHYGQLRANLFERFSPRETRQKLRIGQLIDPLTGLELGVDENDVWIATQAMDYNLVLVTNDRMARIREVAEDLRIENWAQTERDEDNRRKGELSGENKKEAGQGDRKNAYQGG